MPLMPRLMTWCLVCLCRFVASSTSGCNLWNRMEGTFLAATTVTNACAIWRSTWITRVSNLNQCRSKK
uniref:Putative secreted protein n=1 Tax=Anopheles triannulatus TaxID=58253 RepID=A0A2M4B7T1_9DIPT